VTVTGTPETPTATATPAETPTPGPTATPTGPYTKTAIIINFTLPSLQVRPGDSVLWVNQDSFPHTASVGTQVSPGTEFDSPPLANGETYSHTFAAAGTFAYYCEIHPSMTGTITVSN
jgi:plastocyanin